MYDKRHADRYKRQPCRHWLRLGLLLIVFPMFFLVENLSARAAQPQPIYWKQRLFYIPYQLSRPQRLVDPVRKVQLLISRDGVSNWQVLQEAEPNVQGFSYNAPADGEYWFALRHLDRRGQAWPNATVQPQMRIVVDTDQPQLTITGSLDATGAIVVRYEATDVSVNVDTLHLEARPEGGSWVSLQPGLHDVSHPDRLLGRVRWNVPAGAAAVEVRGSISDRAGHRGEANTTVNLTGPALTAPLANDTARDPFQMASQPSQDWPATNQFVGANAQSPPPIYNPYTQANADHSQGAEPTGAPARLIGEQIAADLEGQPQQLPTNTDEDGWQSDGAASPVKGIRSVNSRTFEIDYNLDSVGPWGVSKVELWGTHDDGQTWQSYSVDNDNRSPVRVSVPDSGTYGFRIQVDGVSGTSSPPPRTGDRPELVVEVDLQAPMAEIGDVEPMGGDLTGHLQIQWTAHDANLESRPVSLFYSSSADGPWTAIATQLPNSGSYSWRMQRHLPARFFVRVEVRDQAGNVTSRQTSSPVIINQSQPTGTLRGVRPVEDTLRPYETAGR